MFSPPKPLHHHEAGQVWPGWFLVRPCPLRGDWLGQEYQHDPQRPDHNISLSCARCAPQGGVPRTTGRFFLHFWACPGQDPPRPPPPVWSWPADFRFSALTSRGQTPAIGGGRVAVASTAISRVGAIEGDWTGAVNTTLPGRGLFPGFFLHRGIRRRTDGAFGFRTEPIPAVPPWNCPRFPVDHFMISGTVNFSK
jgi:hypothetical protein